MLTTLSAAYTCTVSDRKNATFSVAVFECFSKLKANIQYTILIRKDWSFIIWNPIDVISIHKLLITNQKRLLKNTIRRKHHSYLNATNWVTFSKRNVYGYQNWTFQAFKWFHVIIEHSQRRKRMHVVLPRSKAITRDTVTNHCKRIDTYPFSKTSCRSCHWKTVPDL